MRRFTARQSDAYDLLPSPPLLRKFSKVPRALQRRTHFRERFRIEPITTDAFVA